MTKKNLKEKIDIRRLAYKNTPFSCIETRFVKEAVLEFEKEMSKEPMPYLIREKYKEIFGDFKNG